MSANLKNFSDEIHLRHDAIDEEHKAIAEIFDELRKEKRAEGVTKIELAEFISDFKEFIRAERKYGRDLIGYEAKNERVRNLAVLVYGNSSPVISSPAPNKRTSETRKPAAVPSEQSLAHARDDDRTWSPASDPPQPAAPSSSLSAVLAAASVGTDPAGAAAFSDSQSVVDPNDGAPASHSAPQPQGAGASNSNPLPSPSPTTPGNGGAPCVSHLKTPPSEAPDAIGAPTILAGDDPYNRIPDFLNRAPISETRQ